MSADCWAGVDVGGPRKGFHVAVVDADQVLGRPVRLKRSNEVLEWLEEPRPSVVAVDSPRRCAPPGERSRPAERELARRVCGIRYTPDSRALSSNQSYYAWIRNGLKLYDALVAVPDWEVVECFPTASWTRWGGPRDASRARWSARVLAERSPNGLPSRMNQDERDAIGAALTARAYDSGAVERFGEIVVPSAI